jgi:hypothetical protein
MGLRDAVDDEQLSLALALEVHLSSNHYPPVPRFFIPTCVRAIELANEGDWDTLIDLPEEVEWNDGARAVVPAKIVESFHLDCFIDWREDY